MTKQYKFYADAGHGWLAVKRAELVELGIIGRISKYSYQKGKTVYLEEDCDMSIFYRAKGWNSPKDAQVVEGKWVARSPIRSYDPFSVESEEG